jgi:subtilase family serine protease
MRRILIAIALPFALLALGSSAAAGNGNGLPAGHKDRDVCANSNSPKVASCDAKVVTLSDGVTPFASTSPSGGYAPVDLLSAYALSGLSSTSTVGIVDAYSNPNVVSDLAAYRSQYGLPACGSGCFTVVNQNGATSPLPSGDTGWGQEIDLDVDMVSAICPTCHILLVEANSNNFTDLAAAANRAALMGATAISNSYGGSEFSGETSYDAYYNHPGIAVTASTGDYGYGVQFPAADSHVVAVGGTSLVRASNTRGWSESAWSGAGSGCSVYFGVPSWQTSSFNTGCSNRAEADVSAVADPNTGVNVYDSYGSSGGANWYVFGGTSVASPIIASIYALAGNTGATDYPARYAYANPGALNDVTSGSNGTCVKRHGWRTTGSAQLCTAGPGWDGPTGLGTPSGIGAF